MLISSILVVALLLTSFLIERKISEPLVISLFVLIIVYGYYFDRSTESIIVANFSERKAKKAFIELTETLKQKVSDQTKDIKEKNKHLQKMLRTQSEFLDISSHQLRTPVSVIKGVISMILDGDMDDLPKAKQREFLQGVRDKSTKLEMIINDILCASEFDANKFSIKTDSLVIHMEDVVDEAVKNSRLEAKQREIDLRWQKPKRPLPMIRGEAKYLEQAVYNLISNALKYTPSTAMVKEARATRQQKGVVRVTVKKERENIIVCVSDNGIGIPKEEIGKLFHKFARAENATAMYTDGSGLGLFIVKAIVEGHYGKVWAESELKKGTNIYISLPIARPDKQVNALPKSNQSVPVTH
ncbi:MAG: HAMP domain-containing sensor histidine kinase [Patescibacteria group bacterium]|nr:HAMP domain-containing sensor histidine kinase [Patescibacteria group bacterium]